MVYADARTGVTSRNLQCITHLLDKHLVHPWVDDVFETDSSVAAAFLTKRKDMEKLPKLPH